MRVCAYVLATEKPGRRHKECLKKQNLTLKGNSAEFISAGK